MVHVAPTRHHVHVKKEEPEDKDDLCKTAGSVGVKIIHVLWY